jgi:AcrR family transcriptional regulator
MSSPRLSSATCPVPPTTTDPIGPAVPQARTEPAASPLLYLALGRNAQNQTTRLLLETERLLRLYGHRKITVAQVADACGFSAANIYRYFSSRRAILDTLASHYLHEAQRMTFAGAVRSDCARDRLGSFLTGLNQTLITFSQSEPQLGELLADAATEQWPCYTRYDALVVGHIAKILAAGSASGEFRLEDDAEQDARRVKAAACALVEPDVIRLCRDKQDIRTREALSRLIAAALLVRPVPPRCASPHG